MSISHLCVQLTLYRAETVRRTGKQRTARKHRAGFRQLTNDNEYGTCDKTTLAEITHVLLRTTRPKHQPTEKKNGIRKQSLGGRGKFGCNERESELAVPRVLVRDKREHWSTAGGSRGGYFPDVQARRGYRPRSKHDGGKMNAVVSGRQGAVGSETIVSYFPTALCLRGSAEDTSILSTIGKTWTGNSTKLFTVKDRMKSADPSPAPRQKVRACMEPVFLDERPGDA